MSTPPRSERRVVLPPPLLFLAALLGGLALQHVWPLALGPPRVAALGRLLAGLLLATGGVLALSAMLLFVRARTTLLPHGRPTALVTGGPYRLTRNPMYVSLTLVYLGATLLLRTPWPLFLLPLPLVLLDRLVIPAEERALRDTHGSLYTAYCQRVRRWL